MVFQADPLPLKHLLAPLAEKAAGAATSPCSLPHCCFPVWQCEGLSPAGPETWNQQWALHRDVTGWRNAVASLSEVVLMVWLVALKPNYPVPWLGVGRNTDLSHPQAPLL